MFYLIDTSKFDLTNYFYNDFDTIIAQYGYLESKDVNQHNYFDWSALKHWSFYYEPYSQEHLAEVFGRSIVAKESTIFLIRLKYNIPLIRVNSTLLKDMLLDMCYETGMGWEAISACGRYILEFTDGYQYLVKSHFEIAQDTFVPLH
jgi:hypothetical protein